MSEFFFRSVLPILASNTLVAVVIALLALLAQRRPGGANLAHCLWVLCLLKLVTPPLLQMEWPAPPPALTTPIDTSTEATAADHTVGAGRPARLGAERLDAELDPVRTADVDADGDGTDWGLLLSLIWLSGTTVVLATALLRAYRFQRQLRHARPAKRDTQRDLRHLARRLGSRRIPPVETVAGQLSPMLWGFFGRARILLPAALEDQLCPQQRRTLLAHELAHYHRRDHWVRGLEMAACSLYWWNPLVWWGCRRLRAAEEECCDAWVLWALPESARHYADALIDTVAFLSDTPTELPSVASGAGRTTDLKRRLMMIMNERNPRTLGRLGRVAFFGLAALTLPVVPALGQNRELQRQQERLEQIRAEAEEQLEQARQMEREVRQQRARAKARFRDLERIVQDTERLERRERASEQTALLRALERAVHLLRESDHHRDAKTLLRWMEDVERRRRQRDPLRVAATEIRTRLAELAQRRSELQSRHATISKELNRVRQRLERSERHGKSEENLAHRRELAQHADVLAAERSELEQQEGKLAAEVAAMAQHMAARDPQTRHHTVATDRVQRLEQQVEHLTDLVHKLLRSRPTDRPSQRRRDREEEEEIEEIEEEEEEEEEEVIQEEVELILEAKQRTAKAKADRLRAEKIATERAKRRRGR